MPYKIIIVDDHKVFAESIASILRNKYEVVEVTSVEKALQIVKTFSPDLILTDLQLPDQDGFFLIKSIKKQGLPAKILVLSSLANQATIHKLVQLEVNGFLNKNVSSIDLLNAIQKIIQGESYFQADIYNDYIKNFKLKSEKVNEITPREIDVLKLIIEEKTTSEIAEILNISSYTVEGYRKNLLYKTGATNVVGLIKYAMKINLI
ncbi:response regulator transcription factor [Flavobacterium jejuense]|uniref:Response regulator transcription factor n=1 Tax=Flavobacterium jejuense TaxID=1544455 RepID=A0ABX0IZ36_9FLAO|nr:response regulator transcription factor [Flavobacterium jejuense]NHN27009.1 response regulator transcription factor [Flavobacterium jejuense]